MGRPVALLFVFALLFSTPALADGYRLLKLDGHYLKWGSTAFGAGARVTYSIATGPHSFDKAVNCGAMESIDKLLAGSKISRGAFLTEIRTAFARWEAVANLRFVYVDDPALADILIGAQAQPRGVAYANVWHHESVDGETARLRKSLICFNPLERWESVLDGRRDTYSIRRVATHEIGHVIGLDHPGRTGQLMGYVYSEESDRLERGDAAGAALLYGRPAPW